MNLCKYSDILGRPGMGLHSIRFANIAVIDVILTIIVAKIVADKLNKPFSQTLVSMFILGIVAHRVFCVRTTVDKMLFKN